MRQAGLELTELILRGRRITDDSRKLLDTAEVLLRERITLRRQNQIIFRDFLDLARDFVSEVERRK